MKLPVQHGNQTVDAEPHLREALDKLLFINPAHEALFAKFFQGHWNTGVIERTMMKSGLPDDFFLDLDEMTEKEAIQAIALRAFHNIVREARNLDRMEIKYGPLADRYQQVECHSDMACPEAQAMHGKTVGWDERGTFPLPACTELWCCCQWEFVLPKRSR